MSEQVEPDLPRVRTCFLLKALAFGPKACGPTLPTCIWWNTLSACSSAATWGALRISCLRADSWGPNMVVCQCIVNEARQTGIRSKPLLTKETAHQLQQSKHTISTIRCMHWCRGSAGCHVLNNNRPYSSLKPHLMMGCMNSCWNTELM